MHEADKIFLSIVSRAEKANPRAPGDYVGADGLLYCGKCKTAKQCRVTLQLSPPKEITPPIMCKCAAAACESAEKSRKEQEEVERLKRLRLASLMEAKFVDSTFDIADFKQNPKAMKTCLRYAEVFSQMVERNQGLLLFGDTGTGKTYAAACICNFLMSKGTSVIMTSFVKILQLNGDAEQDLSEEIKRAGLVVFDDLGAERTSDYGMEKVYGMIDDRYRSGKPMIVTTNLTLDQMKDTSDIRYARIFDRLFEVCYPVLFNSVSWRKKEAGKRFAEIGKILEG
jgi:DNA replication protein DnaC